MDILTQPKNNIKKKIHLDSWCKLHRSIQRKKSKEGVNPSKRQEYKYPLVIQKLAEYLFYKTQCGTKSFLVTAKYLAFIDDSLKKEGSKKTSVACVRSRLAFIKSVRMDDRQILKTRNLGRKGTLITIPDGQLFDEWLKGWVKKYRDLAPLNYISKRGQNILTYNRDDIINININNNITITEVELLLKKISFAAFVAIKQRKRFKALSGVAKKSAHDNIASDIYKIVSSNKNNNLFAVASFCATRYFRAALRYGFDEKPKYYQKQSEVHQCDDRVVKAHLKRALGFLRGYSQSSNPDSSSIGNKSGRTSRGSPV